MISLARKEVTNGQNTSYMKCREVFRELLRCLMFSIYTCFLNLWVGSGMFLTVHRYNLCGQDKSFPAADRGEDPDIKHLLCLLLSTLKTSPHCFISVAM